MTGLDTSFLVALCLREHAAHRAATRMLEGEIIARSGWALASQVLTEFIHVVTDPKRFEHPLSISTALDFCDQWSIADEIRPVAPNDETGRLFTAWMRQHRLGRKRILDTYLAATYFTAGVKKIVTTDWRDFEVFGEFEVVQI